MTQGENSADPRPAPEEPGRVPGPQIGDQKVSVPDAKPSEPRIVPQWTGCRYSMKAYRFRAVCLALVSAAILAGALLIQRRCAFCASSSCLAWGAGLLILLLWCVMLTKMLYRHFTVSYSLDHEHLLIRRGLLRQTTDTVLVAQIDDIKMIQTLADRLVNGGVGTVEIFANDRSDSHLFLEGIDRPKLAFESLDLLRKDYVRRRGIKSFSSVDSGLDDGAGGLFG